MGRSTTVRGQFVRRPWTVHGQSLGFPWGGVRVYGYPVKTSWGDRGQVVDRLRGVREHSVDSPWGVKNNVCGESAGRPWIVGVVSTIEAAGSSWGVSRQSLGHPWGICGSSVDSPWSVHGKSVASPLPVRGQSVDSLWGVRGAPVYSP